MQTAGSGPRIIVPEPFEPGPFHGDHDARDHPVKGIRQTDEPHLARRDPFVDCIPPGHRSRNRPPVPPIQPEAFLVQDVDVEAASRVDDPEARPPPRQLVVEFRGLPPHLLELPVAERQALAAPHLVHDVAVDRTVEVLRIEVEGEFLPKKVTAAPCVRVIDACPTRLGQRGVHVPVVVCAFREVLRQEGPQFPRPPHVVHDQRDVLQRPESTRIDARMAAQDEGVRPISLGPGHPTLRGAVVHPFPVEDPPCLEGRGSKVPRQLVPSARHAPRTKARRKSLRPERYGRSSGSHATWDRSSSASRRAMSDRESSKSKTCAFSRIRSGRTDFGITTRPCWSPHRIKTWAGVCWYSAATAWMTGWSSRCPRVSGLYASSFIPCPWQNASKSAW